MNSVINWIKGLFGNNVKTVLLAEIAGLSKWQPQLVTLIQKYADPNVLATEIITFVQTELTNIVNKVL